MTKGKIYLDSKYISYKGHILTSFTELAKYLHRPRSLVELSRHYSSSLFKLFSYIRVGIVRGLFINIGQDNDIWLIINDRFDLFLKEIHQCDYLFLYEVELYVRTQTDEQVI